MTEIQGVSGQTKLAGVSGAARRRRRRLAPTRAATCDRAWRGTTCTRPQDVEAPPFGIRKSVQGVHGAHGDGCANEKPALQHQERGFRVGRLRSEEHTSELQSPLQL